MFVNNVIRSSGRSNKITTTQYYSSKKVRIHGLSLTCVLSIISGKFFELYENDAQIGHSEFDLKLTDRVKMKMVRLLDDAS